MISLPALGNTYTTITMNLKHRSDVSAIAAAMLMDDDEREILGRLPIGAAVVKLQGRWPRPFQIRIPYRAIPKGSIADSDLIQLMTALTGIVPNSPAPISESEEAAEQQCDVTEVEENLLVDILKNPLSGVVERYRRLGISRRKGNARKESCLAKQLVETVDIPTRSGRIVLLQPTSQGQKLLREHGFEVPDRSRWGSLEHEYWKQKIARHLEGLGFEVAIEEAVNGYTDVVAHNNGMGIAIEIETGRSDWRGNIKKNLTKGFERIVIATTNEQAQKTILAGVNGDHAGVSVIPAWELAEMKQMEFPNR